MRTPLVACLLAVSVAGTSAAADPKDTARPIFQSGVEAFEKGRLDQALELFNKAEGIYHAPPHLLFIARTLAAKKQLVAAKETYKKLDGEKLPPKSPSGFVTAQSTGREELAELEKSIPRLRIRLASGIQGTTSVTLDGNPLSSEQLGTALEVDPGAHTIGADNPGYGRFEDKVEAREKTTAEVEIKLKKKQPSGGDAPPSVEEPPEEDTGGGPSGLRIASFVTMGAGIAGLGVGATFGILGLTKQADSDEIYDSCGGSLCTPAQREEITDLDSTAATFGNVGLISLIAGGAVLGAGIVMFAVSGDDGAPAETPPESSARVFVGPTSVELRVSF